jgi:hypothetical protein
MATFIANRGNAFRDSAPGSIGGGGRVGPIPGGWIQVIGQAGEVIPVTANDLSYKDFQGQGTYVQASGACSIRYSLSTMAQSGSTDPAIRAGAVWTAPQTPAVNEVVKTTAELWVTAEVTFTASGSVAFMAR